MDYEEKRIYDIDLMGALDSFGLITPLYGKEAVQNSIKLWLSSFETDFIRNPGKGGYLTKFLYKLMSEENRKSMFDSIVDGFNQDYVPRAKLKSLNITPDYENKTWVIDLVVYISEIKDSVPVTITVKNFV